MTEDWRQIASEYGYIPNATRTVETIIKYMAEEIARLREYSSNTARACEIHARHSQESRAANARLRAALEEISGPEYTSPLTWPDEMDRIARKALETKDGKKELKAVRDVVSTLKHCVTFGAIPSERIIEKLREAFGLDHG